MSKDVWFRQSLRDFPCPVVLGSKTPSFGLHRYKQGLRFVPPENEGFTLRGDKRRLFYKGRRRSHRFTILGDTSFEYDCILEREPESNVITLLIDGAEHYEFFRQPDFVKNNFLKGSYAVYKKETLLGEGTGKLCHIHRPLIIDALGRRVWGRLAVDGNELRITIPEWWLAGAKYPVVVDPVVGTSTIGAHSGYYDEEYQEDYYDEELDEWVEFDNLFFPFVCEYSVSVNRYQIPQDLFGKATAYVYLSLHSSDKNKQYIYNENYLLQPCLYSDNNHVPAQRLSNNEVFFDHVVNTTNKPDGWRTAAFSTNQIINAGSFVWFGIHSEIFNPHFDYGAKFYNCWDDNWGYHVPPPDICPVWDNYIDHPYLGTLDIILSMYFSYTPMQHYVRTLTQGLKLTDNRKLTAEYKKICTQTVKGTAALNRYETFFRQCVTSVTNGDFINKSVGFLRSVIGHIGIFSDMTHYRELFHKIIETVQAGDFMQRIHSGLREIRDTVSGGDVLMYPVLFVRSINETQTISDIIHKWGDYFRGLYTEAGSMAGTVHRGEYYRTESDAVRVEGNVTRGLLFFVRIITQVFIRDYLLRRFLIAREELVLKSYVCRELKIDSKIS